MAQLIVRNVDDDLVNRLKRRALKHGRPMEAEHRAILENALRLPVEDFVAMADAVSARTRGRIETDSTDLIREDRDR